MLQEEPSSMLDLVRLRKFVEPIECQGLGSVPRMSLFPAKNGVMLGDDALVGCMIYEGL